jgi:Ca-activated chloride channel family protein
MRLFLLISLSLLLLPWQTVQAQPAPADDFFNSGAQFYISNNIPSALEKAEGGLKIYPDDDKLKKLEALLKQQQQQQQNQQNQSQQSQNNQSSQRQNSQGQQKPDEQSGQNGNEQQKQSEQQKSSDGGKNGENTEDKKTGNQPVEPGQMTLEEAKRLLDAQKGDEQILQLKPQGKPENQNRPVKDW